MPSLLATSGLLHPRHGPTAAVPDAFANDLTGVLRDPIPHYGAKPRRADEAVQTSNQFDSAKRVSARDHPDGRPPSPTTSPTASPDPQARTASPDHKARPPAPPGAPSG